jgi:hypothetical protein
MKGGASASLVIEGFRSLSALLSSLEGGASWGKEVLRNFPEVDGSKSLFGPVYVH